MNMAALVCFPSLNSVTVHGIMRKRLHPFPREIESFNLRRLLAQTKAVEKLILELLFVDNYAFLAHTEEAYSISSTTSVCCSKVVRPQHQPEED